MHLRSTVCFRDIGKFTGPSNLYGKNYSGNHLAIFECDMKKPPQLSFVDHDMNDYVNAYRINLNRWKLVDVDNFMRGNSYFNTIQEESVWKAKVRDTLKQDAGRPPIYEEKQYKENPHYFKDVLMPFLKRQEQQREHLDTKMGQMVAPLKPWITPKSEAAEVSE